MEVVMKLQSGKDTTQIIITDDDGAQTDKLIANKDLSDIFQKEDIQSYYLPSPLLYDSPFMIPGLLLGTCSSYNVSSIFFLPADTRYMNFAGEKFMIPFPSLLFYLVSTNGNLISSRCFALKEPVLEKVNTSSILYAFPFGNVMPADAHICWGSIQLPPILNYQDLKTVIEIFFSAESNMDYVHKESSFKGFSDYSYFLKAVRKSLSFPAKALVKSPCVKTISQLFNIYYQENYPTEES